MRRWNRKEVGFNNSSPKILVKAIALFKSAVEQIILEISLAISVVGFSSLFMSWGLVLPLALIVAIALTLVLLILAAYLCLRLNSPSEQKGEVRFAQRISRILTESQQRGVRLTREQAPEWDEYQDWLHDIMLARQEMLAMKCPQWQVKLITYKRLSIFLVVVSINKVKAVFSIKRSC